MKSLSVVVALIFLPVNALAQEPLFSLSFLPEWLRPKDRGGILRYLPTDKLAVLDCPQQVRNNSTKCDFFGQEGVFVCRTFGLLPLSVCTPDIDANIMGVEGDACGCCGDTCPTTCPCECDDGRGVLMETMIVRTWNFRRCVSKQTADFLSPLRDEIRCDTSCLPE